MAARTARSDSSLKGRGFSRLTCAATAVTGTSAWTCGSWGGHQRGNEAPLTELASRLVLALVGAIDRRSLPQPILELVREEGCDRAEGDYFSKPVSSKGLAKLLVEGYPSFGSARDSAPEASAGGRRRSGGKHPIDGHRVEVPVLD